MTSPRPLRLNAPRADPTESRSVRSPAEKPDEARRALGVALQLRKELVTRESLRQLLRIEVGRDQRKRVVMHAGRRRRARSEVVAQALSALAADVLVGELARLAFGESGHARRDAVSDPVIDAESLPAFGIDHHER